MVITSEFKEYQRQALDSLDFLLLECNKQLGNEIPKIERETEFGTLVFYLSANSNNEPHVYAYFKSNDASNVEFVINGIPYRSFRCEIEKRWGDDIRPTFRFSKVNSWDGKKFNDYPTDAARTKVSNTLTQLCMEVWDELTQHFTQYVERKSVEETQKNICKIIAELSTL